VNVSDRFNKLKVLDSRISRNEKWEARLRIEMDETRLAFAIAARKCDTAEMSRLGNVYAEKASRLANVDLILLEAKIARSRLEQR